MYLTISGKHNCDLLARTLCSIVDCIDYNKRYCLWKDGPFKPNLISNIASSFRWSALSYQGADARARYKTFLQHRILVLNHFNFYPIFHFIRTHLSNHIIIFVRQLKITECSLGEVRYTFQTHHVKFSDTPWSSKIGKEWL